MASAAEMFAQEARPARMSFDAWLDTLSAEDRDAFLSRADDVSISHAAFHRVVKAKGGPFGKDGLTAWRRAHGFGS